MAQIKSNEYFQVECLYDEMNGQLSYKRFNEWEIKFIKDLNTRFFGDPEYKLTPTQKNKLDEIWKKD